MESVLEANWRGARRLMKKLIYARSKPSNAGSIVNKVGKYLKDNIDGSYKIAFHPMDCEVFMRMYYQREGDEESFDEMKFIIDITSYQNKIRINLTENTKLERTIGQLIILPEDTDDLFSVKTRVMKMIRKSIAKSYEGFDFVF